jgi:hypothetical protein
MTKGSKVDTINKMEDYEKLTEFISKGERIPEHLLPLLLEVYQFSAALQDEENGGLNAKWFLASIYKAFWVLHPKIVIRKIIRRFFFSMRFST